MNPKSSHRSSADQCAHAVFRAFDHFQTQFRLITQRAGERFLNRDWHGLKSDADERLDLYKAVVDQIVAEVKRLLGRRAGDESIWIDIKGAYLKLSHALDVWELAETFFNSVTRKIFDTVGVDPQIEFVDTCTRKAPVRVSRLPYRNYAGDRPTPLLMEAILCGYHPQTAYEDIKRDARLAAEKVDHLLRGSGYWKYFNRAEMLTSVFYRGKGAYLVGRMFMGPDIIPLVLALFNTPEGIIVDAVLSDENDVSILFSFTRSYFHVDVKKPSELVGFLKTIIPRKRIAELYISIGYNKHGKSELYCDMIQHLSRSDKKFETAQGEKGMVMEVFTMPDYDLVFKVIKDHFAYPKRTTKGEVMGKYDLVFKHDRAGRLVDAQEFEHLKFSRGRFSVELLDGLQRDAAQNVMVDHDQVVIRHAYIERRVTPLNIYLKEADGDGARAAAVDYGKAIKDMAASNIFPGDLLLKNFGVTRHGRVVFYDYDELCLLSDCKFRVMPKPRTYDEEISSEVWFGVGSSDVFPEEFRNFLGLEPSLRDIFMTHHSDLFDAAFWQQIQARLESGEIIDIFPYEPSHRLKHT
ncbi:MAG: bifunctional isocitrate dehydrogenase kinase/phosphatase [Desulfobacterales bacterium]